MKDPRIDRTKRHLFDDIAFIAVASVLSGGDSLNEMEEITLNTTCHCMPKIHLTNWHVFLFEVRTRARNR